MKDLLDSLKIDRHSDAVPLPGPRAHRRRWRRPVLLVCVMAAAGVAAVSIWAAGARPVDVEVVTVAAPSAAGAFAPVLTAGGYVRDAKVVYVAPKVAGRILSLLVREGDQVNAGDVIAVIDSRDLDQEAAEARANYELTAANLRKLQAGSRAEEIAEGRARLQAATLAQERSARDLERTKGLFEAGLVTPQAFDHAEVEVRAGEKNVEAVRQALLLLETGPRKEDIETAQAAVRAANARLVTATNRLEYARVQSPVGGRVLKKFRNVGDFVSPDVPFIENYETVAVGSPVVSLAALGEQEVAADINETDIAKVSLGQRVDLSPNAYPEDVLHGHVTQLSPRADRNKNTVEVKVVIEKSARVLPYDLSVKLTFMGTEAASTPAPALRIPASAVTQKAGKQFVFVASNSRAMLREVETGRVQGDHVTVVRGLSDGDRVIVRGPNAVADGMAIRVK